MDTTHVCILASKNLKVENYRPEEVGHGHVTTNVIVELYGDSLSLYKSSPVLAKFFYQYTRTAYGLNPLVMHFYKSKSTPFNPWVVAVLWSFKYLAVSRLHTGFYLLTESYCPSWSVLTTLQQSTGCCR